MKLNQTLYLIFFIYDVNNKYINHMEDFLILIIWGNESLLISLFKYIFYISIEESYICIELKWRIILFGICVER